MAIRKEEEEFNQMMDHNREMQNEALAKGHAAPGETNPFQSQVSVEDQRVLNEVKTNLGSAPPVAPSQGQCPQCNLFHPPMAPGEKCPNAPLELEGISEDQVNVIVVKVKDILASQLEQKGIKDLDKFAGGLIVELMKYCEGYKE